MSLWKKTMDYLGLGPDEAYEGYDDAAAPDERAPRRQRSESRGARSYADDPAHDVRSVAPGRSSFPSPDGRGRATIVGDPTVNVRPPERNGPPPEPASRAPYPAATHSTEPHAVRARRFDDAQEIADKFKEGLPVIMNLESTDRDVSRRLIDFASGLCYGLDGSMEKVASGVYLLKPPAIRPRHDGF